MAKRRSTVDDLRDLAGGGIEALRVAERLIADNGADAQIQLRVSATRKRLYADAAKRAGKTLTRWLIDAADKAV